MLWVNSHHQHAKGKLLLTFCASFYWYLVSRIRTQELIRKISVEIDCRCRMYRQDNSQYLPIITFKVLPLSKIITVAGRQRKDEIIKLTSGPRATCWPQRALAIHSLIVVTGKLVCCVVASCVAGCRRK